MMANGTSLAKLTDEFRNSCCIENSLQDLQMNASLASECLPQQYCEASSQTDIIGEFSSDGRSKLADRVRLSWQYEEAKKRVSSIQLQLAQLDNESWPGRAEADWDRLQLIREKEALLQELQLISQQKRLPEELARLEAERQRLEDDIQRAQSIPCQEFAERMLLQDKRNCLLRQLEEATRLTTYLHSQLKRSSLSSLSPPSSPLDTPYLSASRDSPLAQMNEEFEELLGRSESENLRLQAQAVCHDLQEAASAQVVGASVSDIKLCQDVDPRPSSLECSITYITYSEGYVSHHVHKQKLLQKLSSSGSIREENIRVKVSAVTLRTDSALKAGRRVRRVSTGFSDDSLATDSGVFEALSKRPEDADETLYDNSSITFDPPQIKMGLVYDHREECLIIHILQLRNLTALQVKDGSRVYIRTSLLPIDPGTTFTFCSKALEIQALMTFSESFQIPVAPSMLRLKTVQLDICSIDQQIQEELLGVVQISLADIERPGEMLLHWYQLLTFGSMGTMPERNSRQACNTGIVGKLTDSEMKDAVSMLLARTTAQLEAVEKQLAEERVKLECTEEEIQEEMKEEKTEAVSE
eukprot:g48427.t1